MPQGFKTRRCGPRPRLLILSLRRDETFQNFLDTETFDFGSKTEKFLRHYIQVTMLFFQAAACHDDDKVNSHTYF